MADGAPHPLPGDSEALPPRLPAGDRALPQGEKIRQTVLDPRRMTRWVYVGRLSIATAIFLAAQLVWGSVPAADTRIASLIFAITMVVTVISAAYTEVYRAPLGSTFLYLQAIYDLLLVTAVVHVTGAASSQFSLFYILVIASAALLLPIRGVLLVSMLGIVCYFADVLALSDTAPDLGVWLQLLVFTLVALACGYISMRLQEAEEGTAAELVFIRLQADDILRNIASGIVTVDEDGILLYANPAARTLLGLPFNEMIGQPVLAKLTGIAPVLAKALERAAVDQVRTTRAEDLVTAGGQTFPVGVTTTFAGGGAIRSRKRGRRSDRTATAIFQDISGQKRLETLHNRAARLEAVAELSASLAHEIKNPLASIRSAVEQLTEMLDKRAVDGVAKIGEGGRGDRSWRSTRTPRSVEIQTRRRSGPVAPVTDTPAPGRRGGREAAPDSAGGNDDAAVLGRLILRESDRLSRLLSEFLDFTRVRMTRARSVDMAYVTRGAANLAAAHPDVREGVRVICVTPELPVVIDGDEDLLHRAVFNLVLNAMQASPADGEVHVELRPIGAEDLPSGVSAEPFASGGVAVRVADSGPGIPPDVRDRLFEPFITTKPGGSGLGLSVVHRAIEAHRGSVLVEPRTDGQGTSVTVLLPVLHADAAESEPIVLGKAS